MCDKKTVYAMPFAAWELRLYLDTHPGDTQALHTYRMLCEEHTRRTGGHAETAGGYAFLPEPYSDGGSFHWVEGPWPWEYGAEPAEGGV